MNIQDKLKEFDRRWEGGKGFDHYEQTKDFLQKALEDIYEKGREDGVRLGVTDFAKIVSDIDRLTNKQIKSITKLMIEYLKEINEKRN